MNNKKLLVGIVTVVFIGAAGLIYCLGAGLESGNDVIFTDGAEESVVTDEVSSDLKDFMAEEPAEPIYIYVHVCGEVNRPEVYRLEIGARVRDGIEMAGGFTSNAAGNVLNQARVLQDGEKLYIPSIEEEKEWESFTQIQNEIVDESYNAADNKSQASDNQMVNINTATLAELMTLRGIGESKAKSILEYRENNGTFRSIEELKNITGIKDGVLDKIRDSITVD